MAKKSSRLSTDLSVARLGKPNGFAPLGIDGKVPSTNLPSELGSFTPILSSLELFVDPDNGDDNNDGLSLGSAFQSIQKAIDTGYINTNIQDCIINLVESSNYPGGNLFLTRNPVFSRQFYFKGIDGSDYNNVIIPNRFLAFASNVVLTFENITFTYTGQFAAIRVRSGSKCFLQGTVAFILTATNAVPIFVENTASLFANNITIDLSQSTAARRFIQTDGAAIVDIRLSNILLPTTPMTVTGEFVVGEINSRVRLTRNNVTNPNSWAGLTWDGGNLAVENRGDFLELPGTGVNNDQVGSSFVSTSVLEVNGHDFFKFWEDLGQVNTEVIFTYDKFNNTLIEATADIDFKLECSYNCFAGSSKTIVSDPASTGTITVYDRYLAFGSGTFTETVIGTIEPGEIKTFTLAGDLSSNDQFGWVLTYSNDADDTLFDNTTNGLTAQNAQAAIDEVTTGKLTQLPGPYADDVAASGGGVAIGQLYYTASGGVQIRLT